MLMSRYVRKTKLALLTAFALAGGTVFTSCGWTDIRDSLIAGSLGAVEGASANWIGGLLIDFNEWIDPFPDAPLIDTP